MSVETNDVALALMQSEVRQLREEVAELSKSTKALVEAWNTTTNVLKFVKLLSTFVAAIAAIYLFIRHGFKAGG